MKDQKNETMNHFKCAAVFLAFFTTLHAAPKEYVHTADEFKIYYSLEGKHALPKDRQHDNNNNHVPDYVDDIAIQLQSASRFFDKLSFTHPLHNPRYKGKTRAINVHIVSMEKYYGLAFDNIVEKKENTPALTIHIFNNMNKDSLAPLHEYFHLVQYGYTMFRNKWYIEGTAKWSETLFNKGTGEQKELPSSIAQLESILEQSYDTKYMWNRLAYLLDNDSCTFFTPLSQTTYSDSRYVMQDNRACGITFIHRFLENLQKNDKLLSHQMQYNKYKWVESDQRSERNNKYILAALRSTINSFPHQKSKELTRFMQVLDTYIQSSAM